MSRAFDTLDHIDAARIQATAALEQGSADDPTYWFYRFDDYALAWIVVHGTGQVPFEHVAHPAVAVLARHDERHGSELVHTLRTFMRCRYNATHAVAELFVARSTLLNRLDRIVQLTSLDFQDAGDQVYLGLSLMFARQ